MYHSCMVKESGNEKRKKKFIVIRNERFCLCISIKIGITKNKVELTFKSIKILFL